MCSTGPAGADSIVAMTNGSAEPFDDAALFQQIAAVADGISVRLRFSAPAHRLAARSSWSVAEAAAHVAGTNRLFAEIAAGQAPPRHGDGTKAGLAEANAEMLAHFTERDPAVLADQIVSQADLFVRAARARSGAEVVDSPLGPMPMRVFSAYVMAHMLSHGCAIAAGLGSRFAIQPRQVDLMRPFLIDSMPMFVDPVAAAGITATYRLRLRRIGEFTLRFADGALSVHNGADGPVDCTISVDSASFFLLALKLCSPWPQIARGKVLAWGRKPWLALRFVGLFTLP